MNHFHDIEVLYEKMRSYHQPTKLLTGYFYSVKKNWSAMTLTGATIPIWAHVTRWVRVMIQRSGMGHSPSSMGASFATLKRG